MTILKNFELFKAPSLDSLRKVILKNEVSDFEEHKMMNIESKRFKIVSTGHGGYMVTNLATNETKYVSSAAINEREFDIVMSNLMKGT